MSVPTVTAWQLVGGVYQLSGPIGKYESLTCEESDAGPGEFSIRTTNDASSTKLNESAAVTVDWNGRRWGSAKVTGVSLESDAKGITRTVTGETGLGFFRGTMAWPNPTAGINGQTSEFKLYNASAEAVIRLLIADNYRDRDGKPVTISTGVLGSNVRVRARMNDLLPLVQRAIRVGAVVADVGLVNSTGTRAALTVTVRLPVNRSVTAVLSQRAGTLAGWTLQDTRPTMTRAVVGGGGLGATRVWARISTGASDTAALRWGGHIDGYIDAGEVFDLIELQQRGTDAVNEAMASAQTFELTASTVSAGIWTRAFVGDTVTVELTDSISAAAPMHGLRLEVDKDGPKVTPLVGDPDGADPLRRLARLISRTRNDVRALQTTRGERTS